MANEYFRLIHHLGGLTGANDNSDMLRGGIDEVKIMTRGEIQELADKGVDVQRLVRLNAFRAATPDEISQYKVAQGIEDGELDFTDFTTGNQSLGADFDRTRTGAVTEGAGDNAAGADGQTDAAKDALNKLGEGAGADALNTVGASGEGTGGTGSAGHSAAFEGMGKGELSELTVPELKEKAKENGVEGYATMLKPELIDTLLTLGK